MSGPLQRKVFVGVSLNGVDLPIGTLWGRARGKRESASFEYDEAWLRNSERYSLDPLLECRSGVHHTTEGKSLFGAIGDSAPDRWGRVLMKRRERRIARREGRTPRTLRQIDYLLMVCDEARQGALRFSENPDGPYLAESADQAIPPLVELPRLLAASDNVQRDSETAEDMRLLFAPGSSLGGARPKASVRDTDGSLLIAKFPQHDDEYDKGLWEAVALQLAEDCGIRTSLRRLEKLRDRSVLLLRRFDRDGRDRIPFLSAMSMLGAVDGESRSYLEIVDSLRMHGAEPQLDMAELWRRIVFSVLISNTDDHLRNHGFLRHGPAGWRLSPVYDVNPVPTEFGIRELSTAIGFEDYEASLELALSVCEYFELKKDEAERIAAQVGGEIRNWRSVARKLGASNAELEIMESAFEHEDAELARSLG